MLAGFPLCLHYACKSDGSDCKWIAPELIDSFIKGGYELTGETKMSYALPEWYKNIDIEKGTILCLDDAFRSLSNILQAVYELVYKQEFWSFKLPPNTTIVLTNNPSSGDFNVNELDEAGMSRMVNFDVCFDINSWAHWAEMEQLDDRCINFMLSYSDELMKDNEAHTHIMNARSYTMFANIIGGIKDWSNTENLALILQIASGCFNDKDNCVGNLFTTFIANKLDKLISAKDLLLGDWKTVYEKLCKSNFATDDDDSFQASVASILHTRLINYIEYYWENKGKTDVVLDRLLDIMHAERKVFSEDMVFNIIKNLGLKYPVRMQNAYYKEEFRSRLIG